MMGHILSYRIHSRVTFFKLMQVNGRECVDVLTRSESIRNILNRVPVGSWIVFQSRRETGTKNFIVENIESVKINRRIVSFRDPLKWNSEFQKRNRYLYLRTEEGRTMILLRSRLRELTRGYLKERGLIEVDTPIISVPSEEGARNYLVPSRLHRDRYYALSQSPQIYKQLLVYSGINYYQISPCFRDEDGRKDRTNGEFYQIDVELISSDLEYLIEFAVSYIREMLNGFGIEINRQMDLSYSESIRLYGTDKPKIGNEGLNLSVIKHFPMFKCREGKWTFMSNPFAKIDVDNLRYEDSLSYQFDVVINGVEVLSGGLRCTDSDEFIRAKLLTGDDMRKILDSYSYMFEAWNSGVPVHGGFGIGFERLLKIVFDHIYGCDIGVNDMVPFPLNENKQDMITGAPLIIMEGDE